MYKGFEKSKFTKLVTVSGDVTKILGTVTLPVMIEHEVINIKLHVIEECGFDVILGKAFIQDFVSSIDIANKLLFVLSTCFSTPPYLGG